MEYAQEFTLTRREKEILDELSLGLGAKEIASKIFISPQTVNQHLKHIYRKMGVNNRLEATLKYMYGLKSFA
jgi:DNA-binding CsgD family transcriptional regulator